MISLIHPSRGRPEKSYDTAVEWLDRIGNIKWEYILSCDTDDHLLHKYDSLKGAQNARRIVNQNRSAVDAINNAAKQSNGDILIIVSDDTICPYDWGTLVEKTTNGKRDFILKTQDGLQPWIITMPIMDRTYYNRFGYIYHPDYLHCFCDTELTCVADITGRKLTSNLLFPHKHYSVVKEPPDATNKRADATWDQGEKLFLERYKRNFDLPKGNPIQGIDMIRWLERKAR